MQVMRTLCCWTGLLLASVAMAAPPGFVKTTISLDAPPAGLAFDSAGVLYALEAADFLSNDATLQAIFPDGTFGDSFPVLGDDPDNFFVGGMAYDPWADGLLITDNTADGRLYAVSKTGVKQTLAAGVAGMAGVAVRTTGEIFVSTAPFGSPGEVLLVDRISGNATPVLGGLGFGAGLAFDVAGDLIVQDADATTFRGRLQRLPIIETPSGLEFGSPVLLIDDVQSSAGVVVVGDGEFFTTGSGGLFRVTGSPLAETPFDDNGNPFQFATAIAFDPGSSPFDRFTGPDSGRLAYMADFGFSTQDEFITLLTPAQPGDYNADGRVDEADYATWRSAFGSTTILYADGSGDGIVDAADYVIWRKHFIGPLENSMASVPEPSTITLTLALAILGITLRRQRPCATPAGSVPGRATPTAQCLVSSNEQ